MYLKHSFKRLGYIYKLKIYFNTGTIFAHLNLLWTYIWQNDIETGKTATKVVTMLNTIKYTGVTLGTLLYVQMVKLRS